MTTLHELICLEMAAQGLHQPTLTTCDDNAFRQDRLTKLSLSLNEHIYFRKKVVHPVRRLHDHEGQLQVVWNSKEDMWLYADHINELWFNDDFNEACVEHTAPGVEARVDWKRIASC